MENNFFFLLSSCIEEILQFGGTAKEAYVCGTFSNWKKIPMVKSQKDFVALIGEQFVEFSWRYSLKGNEMIQQF